MFVNLKIKNIGGIKEMIDLNFISKSRNREESKTCVKTPDGIFINKQIVFIGSNASGKSSILRAIGEVGDFILATIYRKKILENIENNDDIIELKKFLTQISVIKQNVNNYDEPSFFQADMFINGEGETTTGYYKYELEFDKNMEKNGVIREILTYRPTYNSKKVTIITDKENIKESQVGYLNLYANNLGVDLDKKKYIDTFVDHYTKFSTFIQANSFQFEMDNDILEWIKSNPKEVLELVKIFDRNIIDVEIVKNKFDREVIYFITDMQQKLEYDDLSNGTRKMLVVIYEILKTIKSNGVCLIDEIEMGLYKELVSLILKTFYLEDNFSQLIFTSNYPEIIDEKFKFDQVFCLKKEYDTTVVTKLKDYILEDGSKVRADMSLAKAYASGKITLHPSEKNIEKFLNSVKN